MSQTFCSSQSLFLAHQAQRSSTTASRWQGSKGSQRPRRQQVRHFQGCSEIMVSMTSRRIAWTFGELVQITMPSRTGSEQETSRSRAPSTSTTQVRQPTNAGRPCR